VLAPAINVIIAQRLVRQVCKKCVKLYSPSAEVRDHIAEAMRGVSSTLWQPAILKKKDLKLAQAVGCEACSSTGYKGRVGIFEVMPIKGEVEELVLQGANGNRLREAALKEGMTTVLQDGYLKVLDQITTIEEVERVTEE
jgi:type II secretory ATPase GspE/PulE/Tfp pilus assembly ATPase PilB-like protein